MCVAHGVCIILGSSLVFLVFFLLCDDDKKDCHSYFITTGCSSLGTTRSSQRTDLGPKYNGELNTGIGFPEAGMQKMELEVWKARM